MRRCREGAARPKGRPVVVPCAVASHAPAAAALLANSGDDACAAAHTAPRSALALGCAHTFVMPGVIGWEEVGTAGLTSGYWSSFFRAASACCAQSAPSGPPYCFATSAAFA